MVEPPRTLSGGRYELVARLGSGGMGEVWRAWDHRLKTQRAIKLLAPALARNVQVLQRFEREAQAMARLDHPNIVTVHDLVLEEGSPFIVMEVVRGGSLEDWLDRHGVMPPGLALQVMGAVLDALGAAHAQGVIHRDIKPANVLLTDRGVPKVTDFGIAHLVDSTRSITKAGPMGTQAFMPPEQQVDPGRVDGRADLYAVATTMLRLMTGRWPVNAHASVFEDVLFAGVDAALWPVLRRATSADPNDRPATAALLHEELEAARPSLPQVPEGVTLVPRPETLLQITVPPAPLGAHPTTPVDLGAEDATPAPVAPERAPRRSRGLAVGVALLGLVGVVIATTQAEGPAPAPAATVAPTPQAPPPAAVAVEPPTEPGPETPAAQERPTASPPTPVRPPASEPRTPAPQPVVVPPAVAADAAPAPAEAKPAAPEAAPEPAPVVAGTALLTLNAIPFAHVRLDGTDLGETPRTVEVAAGDHRVEFRSLDGQILRKHQVTVIADTPKILCLDLEQDAPCQG